MLRTTISQPRGASFAFNSSKLFDFLKNVNARAYYDGNVVIISFRFFSPKFEILLRKRPYSVLSHTCSHTGDGVQDKL